MPTSRGIPKVLGLAATSFKYTHSEPFQDIQHPQNNLLHTFQEIVFLMAWVTHITVGAGGGVQGDGDAVLGCAGSCFSKSGCSYEVAQNILY